MLDFVIPNNNEKELLARAKSLGSELVFLKEFKSLNEIKKYKKQFGKVGFLINAETANDLNRAKAFKKEVDYVVAISDGSEAVNRAIFESKHVDIALNMASSGGRDHTHYRRGNVNQVLAVLAKENNITYGLSFARALNCKRLGLLMGRWMQNIRVFKKYGVGVILCSFASSEWELRSGSDLKSFLRLLLNSG